nr:ABC transporter permease [Nocardiopsis valliformis]
MVLMFVYLLGGAMSAPCGGDYTEYLIPGMFAMVMVFGLGKTVTAVTTDSTRGVTDRFRSMPMTSSAVVVGRCLADMLRSTVILVGFGMLVGWQWHGSADATLTGFGLLLLLRFALVWIGIYVGLVMRGQGGIAVIQTLGFPIGFLSNAFVATATMPVGLGAVFAPLYVHRYRNLSGGPLLSVLGPAPADEPRRRFRAGVHWPVHPTDPTTRTDRCLRSTARVAIPRAV